MRSNPSNYDSYLLSAIDEIREMLIKTEIHTSYIVAAIKAISEEYQNKHEVDSGTSADT